jgi:branched-chain amino acid transport system permease protein
MAGAAGWLYAHYLTYLSPSSLGPNLSISVLLMVVVGGTGRILGPVVGAVVLDLLTRLLPAEEVQGLFFGGALVLILLLARQGLLGTLLPAGRRQRA